MKPLIVIPYYSNEEIERYVRIAGCIEQITRTERPFQFLLVASSQIPASRRLFDRFSEIAPTSQLQCTNRSHGYPQGPTAMFWEAMDYVGANCTLDGGFTVWLESDMVPVKPDWIDRLVRQWIQERERLLLMGLFVPENQRRRLLRHPRIVPEHINGGACYAKDFSAHLPAAARSGTFDMQLFPYVKQTGKYKPIPSFAFSTIESIPADLRDPEKLILHGWKQDKKTFVTQCIRGLAENEEAHSVRSDAA
jgi:hypothetical protein